MESRCPFAIVGSSVETSAAMLWFNAQLNNICKILSNNGNDEKKREEVEIEEEEEEERA
jgi:hypothetical protein